MKILQQRALSAEERLAARLRLAEKRILQSTLDAVRRCCDVAILISFICPKHCHQSRKLTATHIECTCASYVHERAWHAGDMSIDRTGLGQVYVRQDNVSSWPLC